MAREYSQKVVVDVRDLALQGTLAQYAAAADPEELRLIHRDSCEIIYPVVFQYLTRRHEIDRGHFHCAMGVSHLEPGCLDRFQDDVEAAVSDFIRNARVPIHSVEGWVGKRLNASTVDAYRRRRGARGALQRPRLSRWLVEALHHDAWLTRLALEILEWVGVAHTAGVETWPLTAWADLRTSVTGVPGCTEQAAAADVGTVLAAMRRRPDWYEAYVERPLSRKESPVLPIQRTSSDPAYLVFAEDHEVDDALLLVHAADAVAAMTARIERGETLRQIVVEVLPAVFGSGTGVEDLGRMPGTGLTTDDQLEVLLADQIVIDRVVEVMTDIVEAAPR